MHSEADVAPGAAVVRPIPQLAHCDVEMMSLYLLTGQVLQLGAAAPSANPQPLPIPQAVGHSASTHSTTRLYDCHVDVEDAHFQSDEVNGSSPGLPEYTKPALDPQPFDPTIQLSYPWL